MYTIEIAKISIFMLCWLFMETGKKLFTDKIYAFKYEPIVDTVYKQYKKYGYKPITEEKENIDSICAQIIVEQETQKGIIIGKNASMLKKIVSIDSTLKKYGKLTAAQLVDLTHKEKTPWTMTPKSTWIVYSEIKPEVIKQYHKFEII